MNTMNTYRNTKFTKRDYECTNIVACRADATPGPQWIECDDSILAGLQQLSTQNGVTFYGYL